MACQRLTRIPIHLVGAIGVTGELNSSDKTLRLRCQAVRLVRIILPPLKPLQLRAQPCVLTAKTEVLCGSVNLLKTQMRTLRRWLVGGECAIALDTMVPRLQAAQRRTLKNLRKCWLK